jgi:hypothetical protein
MKDKVFRAESEAAEVEESYRRYIQAYPQQLLTKGRPIDFDALGFWSFPLLIVACPQSGIFMLDEQAFDEMFRSQYDKYREDGWTGRVELDMVSVHPLQPGVAVLESKGSRYRTDGSRIDSWDTFYVLRKAKGIWQTVMITDSIDTRPTVEQWAVWARSLDGREA